jgi:hypothetical protein
VLPFASMRSLAVVVVMSGRLFAADAVAQEPGAAPSVEAAAVRALADDQQPFAARAELAGALQDAARRAGDQGTRGRLSLLWVQTMRRALGMIPMGAAKDEPFHAFLERHKDDAVYSEPAGQWMLWPEAIWKIHMANARSSSAEAIAWEAVDNGMPGECEGYPPCELSTLDALDGEYLRQHPDGAHAAESIKRIGDTCRELERLLSAPNGHELFDPVTDCKDLTPKADALQRAMTGAHTNASDALAALQALRSRCG